MFFISKNIKKIYFSDNDERIIDIDLIDGKMNYTDGDYNTLYIIPSQQED